MGGDDWDRALQARVLAQQPPSLAGHRSASACACTMMPMLLLTYLCGGYMEGRLVPCMHEGGRLRCCRAPSDMQRLAEAVEAAKRALSDAESARIRLCSWGPGGGALHAEVTRTGFEEATAALRARLGPPLERLGQEACLQWAQRCCSLASLPLPMLEQHPRSARARTAVRMQSRSAASSAACVNAGG